MIDENLWDGQPEDKISFNELVALLGKVPGGYNYMGVVSDQLCLPLKSGGELRFMVFEDDDFETGVRAIIDIYDGSLSPGISGPVRKTG